MGVDAPQHVVLTGVLTGDYNANSFALFCCHSVVENFNYVGLFEHVVLIIPEFLALKYGILVS